MSNLLTIHVGADRTPRRGPRATTTTGKGYGDVQDATSPRRSSSSRRRSGSAPRSWLTDRRRLDEVLADGAARAEKVAAETLRGVYDAVGFLPARG